MHNFIHITKFKGSKGPDLINMHKYKRQSVFKIRTEMGAQREKCIAS